MFRCKASRALVCACAFITCDCMERLGSMFTSVAYCSSNKSSERHCCSPCSLLSSVNLRLTCEPVISATRAEQSSVISVADFKAHPPLLRDVETTLTQLSVVPASPTVSPPNSPRLNWGCYISQSIHVLF